MIAPQSCEELFSEEVVSRDSTLEKQVRVWMLMVTDGADVMDPVRLMFSVVVDVASIQQDSFRIRKTRQARDESRSTTLMFIMDGFGCNEHRLPDVLHGRLLKLPRCSRAILAKDSQTQVTRARYADTCSVAGADAMDPVAEDSILVDAHVVASHQPG